MSDTLATALINAQAEMPAVEKTAKANYGKYATLDHIIAKTRGVLNKHGLSIVQFPVVTDLGGPGLKTTILHSSGESVSAITPLFLVKQDMQSLGSAITYARRYAWAAALGISAEADDDGAYATAPNGSGGVTVETTRDDSRRQPDPSQEAAPPDTPFAPPPDVQERLDARQASSVPAPDGFDGSPESVPVDFGKHRGKRLGDVPRAYLEWLAGDGFDPQTKDKRLLKNAAKEMLGLTPAGAGVVADDDIPFVWTWA